MDISDDQLERLAQRIAKLLGTVTDKNMAKCRDDDVAREIETLKIRIEMLEKLVANKRHTT